MTLKVSYQYCSMCAYARPIVILLLLYNNLLPVRLIMLAAISLHNPPDISCRISQIIF